MSYKNLDTIITENLHRVLIQEGKDRRQQARAKTKRVIEKHFNNNAFLYEPNEHTNGVRLIDYLEQEIMRVFFHERHRSDAKGTFVCLEPLVAKIALENGWQQDRDDTAALNRLAKILNYIDELYQQGKIDPKTISLDTTFEQLNQTFGILIDQREEKEKKHRETHDFGGFNKNYTIKEINTFKEANKIGKYSYSNGQLCYTEKEGTWENFTKQGANKVYCCLTKDWQTVSEKHSESLLPQYPNSNGYDRYGLSMIFVFVNLEGDLAGSNTRWNHEATYGVGRSVDNAFTKNDLSKLFGVAFESLFKPHSLEYRREHGLFTFQEVLASALEKIRNGQPLHSVFDRVGDFHEGFARVELQDKWNFINTEERIISDQWFDMVGDFNEGFAKVYLQSQDKYNIINTEGRIISNQWFDKIFDFHEGFAIVRLQGEYNFINAEGQYLSNQWFDLVGDFHEGFASVNLQGKWNSINAEGRIISDQWFDWVGYSYEGFAKVLLQDKYNFINTEGRIISNQWFDDVDPFNEGFAKVYLQSQDKYNFIDTEGHFISDQWFEDIYDFNEGFAIVKLQGKWNFINAEGRIISNQWFEDVLQFHEGFASVYLQGKWNFINAEGCIISDQWFNMVNNFREGFAKVKLQDKYNFVNTEGRIISNQWFDDADPFNEGFARVEFRRTWNFINTEGHFISDQWFAMVGDFDEGFAKVLLQGEWFYMNTKGKLSKNKEDLTESKVYKDFYDLLNRMNKTRL